MRVVRTVWAVRVVRTARVVRVVRAVRVVPRVPTSVQVARGHGCSPGCLDGGHSPLTISRAIVTSAAVAGCGKASRQARTTGSAGASVSGR